MTQSAIARLAAPASPGGAGRAVCSLYEPAGRVALMSRQAARPAVLTRVKDLTGLWPTRIAGQELITAQ